MVLEVLLEVLEVLLVVLEVVLVVLVVVLMSKCPLKRLQSAGQTGGSLGSPPPSPTMKLHLASYRSSTLLKAHLIMKLTDGLWCQQ